MSSSSTVQLSPLLPSTSYVLPYAVPLLLLSLVFCFAGTFLTLDRTRTFPRKGRSTVYASLPVPGSLDPPKKSRFGTWNWALEGGVGGLIGGYLLGLHLSTALSLLIPATSNLKPLTPKPFLAIWILSTLVTTPLSGRYRYFTFPTYGLLSGTLLSLSLCIIIHPSLRSRVILTATFLILFTLLSVLLIFIPHLARAVFHAFLRVCTASTGAFGLTLAIALLLNPQERSWANIWERLYTADGDPHIWASSQERGLSAAWGLFFSFGLVVDYILWRWIGECPDEKWDTFLKEYTDNLPMPHHANRAGSFKPFTSVWDRMFGGDHAHSRSLPTTPYDFPGQEGKGKEILFPNETEFKAHMTVPFMLHNIPHAPHTGFQKTSMGPNGKLSKKPTVTKGMDEESGLLASNLAKGIPKSKSKRKTSGGKIGGFFGRKREEDLTKSSRKPVKFGSLSSDSDSDTEDGTLNGTADDETKRGGDSLPSSPVVQYNIPKRPGLTRDFSTAATLVERGAAGERKRGALPELKEGVEIDYEKEIEMVKDKLRRNSTGPRGPASNGKGSDSEVEYSDYEDDLGALKSGMRTPPQGERGGEQWVPGFMKRHSLSPQQQMPSHPTHPTNPSHLQQFSLGTGAVPIPATPSLIRAIDRITTAQRDAFGPSGGLSGIPSRDASSVVHGYAAPNPAASAPMQTRGHIQDSTIPSTGQTQAKQERAPRWEEFWREVKHTAQS